MNTSLQSRDTLPTMNTKTPVAIIVRVSTTKQENDRQIHELTEVAKRNQWDVVEVIEEKVSGNSRERSGLDRAVELARTHTIQKVLVHEVSRVARRNSVAHQFLETLSELGVSLYWHAQSIETLLPNGKRNPAAALMFALMAEIARNERETMVERVRSGLAEARRKGIRLGRKPGSGETPEQFLQKHATIVRRLREGQSVRNTAKIVDVSTSTVQRVRRVLKDMEV